MDTLVSIETSQPNLYPTMRGYSEKVHFEATCESKKKRASAVDIICKSTARDNFKNDAFFL